MHFDYAVDDHAIAKTQKYWSRILSIAIEAKLLPNPFSKVVH